MGKSLLETQNLSRNGFFPGKHHPEPAVEAAFFSKTNFFITSGLLLRLNCSTFISQPISTIFSALESSESRLSNSAIKLGYFLLKEKSHYSTLIA